MRGEGHGTISRPTLLYGGHVKRRCVRWGLVSLALLAACSSGAGSAEQPGESPRRSSPAEVQVEVQKETSIPSRLRWQTLATGTAAEYRSLIALASGRLIRTASPQRVEVVNASGRVARTLRAGQGWAFDEVLMTGRYLVAVAEDDLEEADARATVLNVRTGRQRTLNVMDVAPLTHGGSWAGHDGTVVYPTREGSRYCIAAADLRSERGSAVACAPPRNGLNSFAVSPAGIGFLSFDDQRPISCRTANVAPRDRTGYTAPASVTEPERCAAWDVVPLPGGAVLWSHVPDEERIERAIFFVRETTGQVHRLGPGVTGSVVWCGNAAWFSRDEENGRPATLLRWTRDQELQRVYQAPRDHAGSITAPRCAGAAITVTVWGENTFLQVTASSY